MDSCEFGSSYLSYPSNGSDSLVVGACLSEPDLFICQLCVSGGERVRDEGIQVPGLGRAGRMRQE